MIGQYESINQIIVAVQWSGENIEELSAVTDKITNQIDGITITTEDGETYISHGDYLIKDMHGRLHICPGNMFNCLFNLYRNIPVFSADQEKEIYSQFEDEIEQLNVSLMRKDGEMQRAIKFRKKVYYFPASYSDRRIKTELSDKVFQEWKGLSL